MGKKFNVCLYTVLFILVCLYLKEQLVYIELPSQMNATYCKCNAPQSNKWARVFNGTEILRNLTLPWTVALYMRNRTHFGLFCTGAGESFR